MITFQTFRILMKFRKMTKRSDSTFCFSESYTDDECGFYCSETDRSCNCLRYKKQIQCLMDFLVKEGYLAADEDGAAYYQLTYIGLHPLLQLRHFIFSSVLLPAFVAFLSSALAHFLLESACKIP